MDSPALDLTRVTLKRRRTKIVATVGPVSSSDETLTRLVAAGVDVFRINFSHGSHDVHGETYRRIREVSRRAGLPVAILADLCGPKIRVGMFAGGSIELAPGERVVVTTRNVEGGPKLIPSQYAELSDDVKAGDRILLDDGKLELRVSEKSGTEIGCEVVQGGTLSNKKGMNLPGVSVSTPALTEKDKADAAFATQLGVDYLALSFVRCAQDVLDLRDFLSARGASTPIIAKIEKPEALQKIHEILGAAQGIMIARGDLGVEMAAEELPIIQQELIRLATGARKPVIVATQMLESMIENARPTRAEVTDVAWAGMAQADAVMLSGETSVGKHPVGAVATMDRVLRLVEGYQWRRGDHGRVQAFDAGGRGGVEIGVALSRATALLSGDLQVHAIAVPTKSGATARLVSAARPAAPIVAIAYDEAVVRRLNLLWGVSPRLASREALGAPQAVSIAAIQELGLASPGDPLLMVWDVAKAGAEPEPTVSILRAGR